MGLVAAIYLFALGQAGVVTLTEPGARNPIVLDEISRQVGRPLAAERVIAPAVTLIGLRAVIPNGDPRGTRGTK